MTAPHPAAAIRLPDWWTAKIPPLLAVGYAGVLVHALPARVALPTLAALVVAVAGVAAFGYVLNDACDVAEDARRGKSNAMAALRPGARAAWCLALGAAAFVPLVLVRAGPAALALLGANLLVPALYSLPPVRLKERGLAGVLADAGAAHLLPTLVVAATLAHLAEATTLPAYALAAAAWAFAAGLRGILAHQVRDRDPDRAAGVQTFGAALGPAAARVLIARWLLPAEAAMLAGFAVVLLPQAPLLALAAAGFAALEWGRRRVGWALPLLEQDRGTREPYLPLASNEFHEVWMPLALAADLARGGGILLAVPALHIAAFLPNIRARLAALRALGPAVRDERQRRAEAAAAHRRTERPARHWRATGSLRDAEVIVLAPAWTLNGVNVFAANLLRGLREAGVRSRVLLTEEQTALVRVLEARMPHPDDLEFDTLPVRWRDGWGAHWGATAGYLEAHAPCVVVPNSDWRHSCVIPRLSSGVAAVGVVHSDDPLHYDHVLRLGRYWDVIVAVSRTLGEQTAQRCPDLIDRLVTIPIGVTVPDTPPVRTRVPGAPLRVVYHGTLKQHQKRVLDLPRVVAAAVARGVPLELTIAGGGPDEAALRAAAAPLVARGLIRFLGVVPHGDIPCLLEASDVYLLTSEFEGMPNALLEAMGRGCVPVVSAMASGIPDVVRDGANGLLAPIGDVDAFAERLAGLARDPALLAAMAQHAWAAVHDGAFTVQDMVADYVAVFDRALHAARRGGWRRPPGPIFPPPASVGGVSVFPVPLQHAEPGLGPFPTQSDAAEYRDHCARALAAGRARPARRPGWLRRAAPRVADHRVVIAAPLWTCNGVNTASEDLVRGLRAVGVNAELLLTEERTALVSVPDPRLPTPSDIPVTELRVEPPDTWGARWGAMQAYLEHRAPCIWLPNHDWRHACVAPRLSRRVLTVGVVPGTDPLHLEQAARLGASWNAAVAWSPEATDALRAAAPALARRVVLIRRGLRVPAQLAPRSRATDAPLRIAWCDFGGGAWPCDRGALDAALRERGVPAVLDTVDARADLPVQVDIDIVVPRWPGPHPPDVLWELLGTGAIPVLLEHLEPPDLLHETGIAIPAPDGNPRALADTLGQLLEDRAMLRERAARAHARIVQTCTCTADTARRYLELFDELLEAVRRGAFRRPRGAIAPPPPEVNGVRILPVDLPFRVPGTGRFASAADYRNYRRNRAARGAA